VSQADEFPLDAPVVVAHADVALAVVGTSILPGLPIGLVTWAGRANARLGRRINLELETGGARIPSADASLLGGYAHLWTTPSRSSALGVFGGSVSTPVVTLTSVGLEGKVRFGPIDLTGTGFDNFPTGGASFWAASAAASFTVNPNLRAGARATLVGRNEFRLGGDSLILTGEAQRRVDANLSVWGSVTYITSAARGGDLSLWAIFTGARFSADTQGGMFRSMIPWRFTNPLQTY
jgi:hypothetical protein